MRSQLKAERDALAQEAEGQRQRDAEEAAKLHAERQAFEAEKTAQRAAQAPKAAPLPSSKDRAPSEDQILRVLSEHFGVAKEVANQWLLKLWGGAP
jgi:regulator of protease activity HflC (stomatin/prohibitin superfamily)